jgi:HAD superfamily hydrolase (TIGR01459 family)
MSFESLTGIRPLIERYDAFLVDQFGVLHDGQAPYPGAVDALGALHAAGKRVLILTNSGKRSHKNRERVIRLGFPGDAFEVLSSGEVAWQGIRDGSLGAPFVEGSAVHVIGRPGEDYGVGDLDLRQVDDPGDADFVLIAASDAPRMNLDRYRQHLAVAAERGVPALCCNPDINMLTEFGLQPAPGAIAALYRELGGSVLMVGKPHQAIYCRALAMLDGIPASRIVAVGDSLEHDIRGAHGAGIGTALVRTGILADLTPDELERLTARLDARPDVVLPAFRLGEA